MKAALNMLKREGHISLVADGNGKPASSSDSDDLLDEDGTPLSKNQKRKCQKEKGPANQKLR